KETLQRVMPVKKMFGSDLVLIAELAIHGTFAAISDEWFALQRLDDFGNFYTSFKKVGLQLRWWSPITWYARFIWCHAVMASRVGEMNFLQRMQLAAALTACILLRYDWVPKTVREAIEQEKRSRQCIAS